MREKVLVCAVEDTRFEGLLERLQTPAAREGLQAAFNATPAELGRAAAQMAQRQGGSGAEAPSVIGA